MNSFGARVFELRNQAERLLLAIIEANGLKGKDLPDLRGSGTPNPADKRYRRWLKTAGCIGSKDSPKLKLRLAGILSLLKEHVRTSADLAETMTYEKWPDALLALESRLEPALQQVRRALNSRVSKVELGSMSPEHGPWYVAPTASRLRLVAENLVRYHAVLAEEPRLIQHIPLDVCPRCDGLYLLARSNQGFCSSRCRFREWVEKKQQVYPRYFADKESKRRKLLKDIPGLERKAKRAK